MMILSSLSSSNMPIYLLTESLTQAMSLSDNQEFLYRLLGEQAFGLVLPSGILFSCFPAYDWRRIRTLWAVGDQSLVPVLSLPVDTVDLIHSLSSAYGLG